MGPQSPGNRHDNFQMPNTGGPQGQYNSRQPLHSPAHQQQQGGQIHPGMTQMHRGSSQSRNGQFTMQQTHDNMMGSSNGRNQQYMGNSMGSDMDSSMNSSMSSSMNNSMNNSMNGNTMMPMGNPMNMMGNSMNSGMPNMTMNPNVGSGTMNVHTSSSSGSMRSSSGTTMNANMNSGGGMSGNWQTDRDTQYRRDMIQHM